MRRWEILYQFYFMGSLLSSFPTRVSFRVMMYVPFEVQVFMFKGVTTFINAESALAGLKKLYVQAMRQKALRVLFHEVKSS